jgi:hypothetical protein
MDSAVSLERISTRNRKRDNGGISVLEDSGGIENLSGSTNPLDLVERLRENPESTEFVYLRHLKIDENTPLNPYHLEIVPHAEIDEADFFTLSSFGVTHFVNGRPEFTELEQWKRENNLFKAIIRIPVGI